MSHFAGSNTHYLHSQCCRGQKTNLSPQFLLFCLCFCHLLKVSVCTPFCLKWAHWANHWMLRDFFTLFFLEKWRNSAFLFVEAYSKGGKQTCVVSFFLQTASPQITKTVQTTAPRFILDFWQPQWINTVLILLLQLAIQILTGNGTMHVCKLVLHTTGTQYRSFEYRQI